MSIVIPLATYTSFDNPMYDAHLVYDHLRIDAKRIILSADSIHLNPTLDEQGNPVQTTRYLPYSKRQRTQKIKTKLRHSGGCHCGCGGC